MQRTYADDRLHQLAGEMFRRSSAAVATSREGHRQQRSDLGVRPFPAVAVQVLGAGAKAAVARHGSVKTVLPVATKKAVRVAQNLLANERIGICAHNDSAGLAAGGPTHNISFRRIAWHDCDARCRVRVSLLDIRALPVRLPSIGR